MIPFSNKKGLELIGYDAGYLATHSFLDLLHPDDRTSAWDRHQRRLLGEKLDPLAELRVTDGNGVQHWLEINAIPVPWDGKPASLNFATDITERKRADDALAESERSYHGLFNTVKEAIYIQDSDGCFLNVNDGAVAMYGYPHEYFIGKSPEILSAEGCNDLKELNDHFRRAFLGEPQYFEFWGKRKNGEVFPKEVRLYKGSYFGKDVLIAVALDITERKNAEEAIKESEERFRTLLQRVPTVAIQGYRPDHTVVYWNEANTRIYGYTAEEALGKDLRDLIVPGPARGEVTAAIARVVETGIPEPGAELDLMRKDGSLVSIFSSHSVVKIPGRSTVLYCIDIDLTERKRAEEALKNSETYLKTIISSVQTGLVIIDPETHTIVDVNPAAENLIGVKREELIGSLCHKFICPAQEGNCPVTDLGNTVDNSERTLLTSDGLRSILKTVVPVTLSGRDYLLESFIDITDRKHAEAMLAESEAKFHLIFRNSNDAIYLFEITASGMPGRIVDANEVASLQTAHPKENLLKKTFLEIHSHELPQKSRSIMMELLTKGQVRFETDVARKDGAKLPVEVSAQFAKLNQKTYVIAISRDISRRKREERALRIANQKLQLMNIVA
jgi:PAS domain S-box-containing protein